MLFFLFKTFCSPTQFYLCNIFAMKWKTEKEEFKLELTEKIS